MALGTLAPKELELGELFRSLYLHMAEGVALHAVICDEAGQAVNCRILDVKPQYERYTYTSEELLAKVREALGTSS